MRSDVNKWPYFTIAPNNELAHRTTPEKYCRCRLRTVLPK
jgi:hypothetical protein